MSLAGQLLTELRRRGVTLEAHGDRLRYRPVDRVTDAERNAMCHLKPDLLRLLANDNTLDPAEAAALRRCYRDDLDEAERARLAAEAEAGDPLIQLVVQAVACTPEPSAWRLYSRRLDRELWLARDAEGAAALDRDGARAGLPVVLAGDLEQLRDFDDRRLNNLLDALACFPGSRLAEHEAAS